MSSHIIDGEFQSDKYPTCPRGKVPLSVKDPTAQDLLWEYAQRRRSVDAEFSEDLETALVAAGYLPITRAARAADAERVRSVVREAALCANNPTLVDHETADAIAARAAEQLAGVRSDQREMDVACYAEVKRERDGALSECERLKSQLAGAHSAICALLDNDDLTGEGIRKALAELVGRK